MSAIDRLAGLVNNVAIKTPCRLASITNITLSGLQTIDSVLTDAGDRVLVTGQTDTTANGIYVADSGTWTRDVDFSGAGDFVQGTMVNITTGTIYANSIWMLTTVDPVINSPLAFEPFLLADLASFGLSLVATATASAARTLLGIQPSGGTGGRLTLISATPVMTADETGQGAVFYTPYCGRLVPIWNTVNSSFDPTPFDELANNLAASSVNKAGPAAVVNNSNYDLFVWLDSGTMRLTRGPAWTSGSARGTGAGTSELTSLQGLQVNANNITNGPTAGNGTYVGSIRTNGSAQVDFKMGGIDSPANLAVWNRFNRVPVGGAVTTANPSWSYNTAAFRNVAAGATFFVSILAGLIEDELDVSYTSGATHSAGSNAQVGIGFDSLVASVAQLSTVPTTSAGGNLATANPTAEVIGLSGLGLHFYAALETGFGVAGTMTWSGPQSCMTYRWRY